MQLGINLDHRPTSLVSQSIGSMALSWKALNKFTPDIYFDTTGHAFTFLVARILAGCKVGAYVHYPTISTVRGIISFSLKDKIDAVVVRRTANVVVNRCIPILLYFSLTTVGHAINGVGASTNVQQ